jgi:hypothetical protein
MAAEVILNIFSERPNPRWVLDDAQTCELSRLLASLEELPPPKAQLKSGYRGLLIRGEADSSIAGLTQVFRGVVKSPQGTFRDGNRSLERWLLDTAGAALTPDVRDRVAPELEE